MYTECPSPPSLRCLYPCNTRLVPFYRVQQLPPTIAAPLKQHSKYIASSIEAPCWCVHCSPPPGEHCAGKSLTSCSLLDCPTTTKAAQCTVQGVGAPFRSSTSAVSMPTEMGVPAAALHLNPPDASNTAAAAAIFDICLHPTPDPAHTVTKHHNTHGNVNQVLTAAPQQVRHTAQARHTVCTCMCAMLASSQRQQPQDGNSQRGVQSTLHTVTDS